MIPLQFFLLVLLCPIAWAASRTSPPAGAIVVRQSGATTGQFTTIQAAVNSLGSGTTAKAIFIYPGTYREQVSVQYGGPLTIYGSTTNTADWKSNTVTLTNNRSAAEAGSNDASGTLRALKNDFKIYNVNIANTFGLRGQALAISARGTRQGYYGCKITGGQDTLYADSGNGVQHYAYCWIEGTVDFIFGRTSGWFEHSTIASVDGSAVTAMSRETTSDPTHYVFDRCTLVSTGANLKNKVFLGRPWRVLARTTWQNSNLGDLVHPDGYTTMAAGATPVYAEFGNTGSSADTSKRKYFTRTTAAVSRTTVLGSNWTSWADESYSTAGGNGGGTGGTNPPPPPPPTGGDCAAIYGQCGGSGWTGATCCASGSTCKVSNEWYSQCLP